MKNKKILAWLIICCMTYSASTNTSWPLILKNLQTLTKNLGKGCYKKAILVSPSFTNTAPLIEAADHGTKIMLISKSKSCPIPLLQHPNITYRHATVHDKLYFTKIDDQSSQWSCHLGSANFSFNGLGQNRELIVQIEDALCIPGLAKHAQAILNSSMIPDNLPDPGNKIDNDFSELASASTTQQLADLERINNENSSLIAAPRVISSFQTDIINHLSQSIKTDYRSYNYCVSAMVLNHPLLIKKLLTAASLCDSNIKIIVDKRWAQKKLQSNNEFTHLTKKAKQSDSKIQIRAASRSSVPGYHHAKLLIREPINPCDHTGLSIISTANITSQAKRDSNCVLEIPHADNEKNTTQDLKKNFEEWWENSEGIGLS